MCRDLIFDNFDDALAAGTVDGKPATPGPGARRVTDAESHLSLSGGKVVVSGGLATPDYNDPSLTESNPAITRVVGQLMVGEFNQISGAHAGIGWYSAAPLTVGQLSQWENTFYDNLGTWHCATKGTAKDITAINLTAGVSHQYAIVLKTVGAYYFARGDTLPDWSLILMVPTDNTATLYPGIANREAVFTSSFLRAPEGLYLPSPTFSDTFTRADGAIGSSEITGPDGQVSSILPWTGATWTIGTNRALNTPNLGAEQNSGTLVVGTWYSITATQANHFYTGCAIGDTFCATSTTALDANNKVKALTLSELSAYQNVNCPNVYIRVKVHALKAGTQGGVTIRVDDPTNPTEGIIAYFDGQGNLKLKQFIDTVTYSELYTVAKAFTVDDELIIWANGNSVRCHHRTAAGVWTSSGIGLTTSVTSGGYTGAFSTDPANTIEEIDCFPVGSYGEYAVMDTFVPSSLRIIPKYSPSIVFTFDDGLDTLYTQAYNYMLSKGVRGTAYIITSLVDTGGHVTHTQLLEMQAAGWTIGNHTRTHTNMVGRTQAQDEQDISDGYNDLIGWGITPENAHHFAYPGGGIDANARAAVAAQGCLTARMTDHTITFPTDPFTADIASIWCHFCLGNTYTLRQTENYIDRFKTNQEMGLVMCHDLIVGEPSDNIHWKIANFQALIDRAIAKGLGFLAMDAAYIRWHI